MMNQDLHPWIWMRKQAYSPVAMMRTELDTIASTEGQRQIFTQKDTHKK